MSFFLGLSGVLYKSSNGMVVYANGHTYQDILDESIWDNTNMADLIEAQGSVRQLTKALLEALLPSHKYKLA